jgi:transposase InsO family protein
MSSESKLIKSKLGLLELGRVLGNVSRACRILGFSSDSFYRFERLYAEGGESALQKVSHCKPNLKNRVSADVESAVLSFAFDNPAFGKLRVSNELRRRGIVVSPGGVRSILLRNNLETYAKRLKSLSSKVNEGGIILSDEQVSALERAKEKKVPRREIETHHPGYLGSQDTCYIGHIKGVGYVYQQTFIDIYSKVGFAKLYDRKNALTAADLLNDRVIPFFEENDLRLLRILTDRGGEYCGDIEQHKYQLYLATENIEHTRTKPRSPHTNGICERFHRTIKDEFYAVALRRKMYYSIEQLQQDLDIWMNKYNSERTHTGKYCNGKTPLETFNDGIELAKSYYIGASNGSKFNGNEKNESEHRKLDFLYCDYSQKINNNCQIKQ